jgi:hypothetical protein
MATMLLCVGCAESKLDTTSDQAFSESLKKIHDSLPEAERTDFRWYVAMVAEGHIPYAAGFGEIIKKRPPSYDEIIEYFSLVKAFNSKKEIEGYNRLNGLTKTDIITQGKAILKEGSENRLKQLDEEIAKISKFLEDGIQQSDWGQSYSEELEKLKKVKTETEADLAKATAK